MHEPLVPMLFPSLWAHISGAEIQYPDLSWKEICSIMAHLVGNSGCNKGQLSNIVEAVCRDFLQVRVIVRTVAGDFVSLLCFKKQT